MPLTVRNSARRRRKTPDEKLPERAGESTSSAQVMAPTRMKLRVRRRDNAAAAGGGQPEEEEERRRESGGRSSRRKNASSTAAAATSSSTSPPPSSSSSASARAVMAAEEASPDSKCPICLDRFNNLAYLDRCLHRFCFPCIQEWSHNKAECPLCKQPFASILHSVRAEDDFKEYTLRPAPANSSVAATVAMVAAMASAARSDHQMRLMLRRHRGADGGETMTRRRRRERGGRGGGGRRSGVWEWYLDSPPLTLPPLPHNPAVSPVVAEDSEEGEELEEQRMRGGADLAERGVIFEGLTGLGGTVAPVAPNNRASRRLMTRLVARQRVQREGGTIRRLRERETVAFRRALYRSGIRVRGVAGVNGNQGQGRDITAESFRRNPTHLNRLRPWLRRELTVLYGAHGSLVDIVQRIIMARLARHGLEDTPTIEEELRPFLLARTDHFLHELVSFARSPLSLEHYDMHAVYEPPDAALELGGTSSSTDSSSSVIAISEGEEEERRAGGRSEERLLGRAAGTHDDVIQAGSCLSLAAWDDETPGPSYSTAEPSCSLTSPPFSPAPQEAANEEAGEKWEEEECLIVGYKKPIAERTPELVQLSSDTEEEEEKKNPTEKPPPLPATTPPLSYLPTIPPSTSGAYSREKDDGPMEKVGEVGEAGEHRARSWSGSSGRSRNSVCTLSPVAPGESERQREKAGGEAAREKRRRKRRRRGRERSGDRLRKSGTLYNPNRSIYPAMMRHLSHSPSPFHSSVESGSPLPPSPPDSSWEYHCSQVSPLTSSVSSPPPSSSSSSSSPLCSSPQPSSQTAAMPSLSPSNNHHGEKPGGKRKYKSRHLDSDDKDPTWKPSSSREKRREKEGRKRRQGRKGRDCGESSVRRSREDRSPSVEIIYEGTVISNATQPPAHKRRRKQHRKTQHSSSPVIITLDSDSSHDDDANNSGSSSPISSQQTIDFSDLPPLPLVHSASVGGALNAEIGELPVDILDRGSDGLETEPGGPIAVVNSDNSDHDVDVENVEEVSSLLGSDDDNGPMRMSDTKSTTNQREADESAATATNLVHKRDSETSDSHLLATILNDLKGISAPKRKPSLNFDPSYTPNTRKRRLLDQREVSQANSNQDDCLAETRLSNPDLPEECPSSSIVDQSRGSDLPTCAAIRPVPPLERLKERRVGDEGKDVPPLLKQASPVRSHNRNTPPPLKHKDAGSPHPSPIPPIDLHSPHAPVGAEAADSRLVAELPKDNQPIPPISTLKRRFTSALALRGAPASTSSASANDMHSSSRSAPIDSHSPSKVGLLTVDIHSSSGSENSPSSVDCLSHLDFNSFHSSKLHSGRDSAKEISSSGARSSPIDLHPVNSLSPTDFHSGWSKEKPPHNDSTSRGCRDKTLSPNSCRVAPFDLHPSSRVSAEGAPAGGDVFSGVNSNDTSPLVFVSSIDSSTQNPSSAIDFHSCSKRENLSERPPHSTVSSVPTTAPSGRLSPIDVHSGSPKSTVDLHPSSAASEGLMDKKETSLVNHGERLPYGRLPPIDLHCPVPPANVRSSSSVSAMIDEHLNHTALSSATFQTLQKKPGSQPVVESHSKLLHLAGPHSKPHNHFVPRSQFPIDARSKLPIDSQPPVDSHPKNSQRDFHLRADNHITSSPQSVENRWNSNSSIDAHSDSQSPIDDRSASSIWNTHTHTELRRT